MASRSSNYDSSGSGYPDRRHLRSEEPHHQRFSPTRSRYSPPHDSRHRSPPRGPSAMEQSHYRRERRDDTTIPEDYYDERDHKRHSPSRDYEHHDHRRSRHRSRSPHRPRSQSPRRRDHSPWYGGATSRDVIMEGLPVEFMDKDIRNELEEFHKVEGLTDVRVIRDKRTGVSRGFGFLQFRDVQAAKRFLRDHYPKVHLFGQNDSPVEISISFGRERDDRDRNGNEIEWICGNCMTSNYPRRSECYKCQAPKSQYAIEPVQVEVKNNGDSDVSLDSTPTQFILLRGLELSVTEDLLAKGVAKLYKSYEPPNAQSKKSNAKVVSTTSSSQFGAQDGSLKRVFIVRDRSSDESWRYGFAEFHSIEDTQAAVAKFNSLDNFTIASKPILVSYIHAGVFVPVTGLGDQQQWSFSASSNSALRLAYWDQKAYLRELIVCETPPAGSKVESVLENEEPSKDADQKTKKRKAEPSAATPAKKAMPSHLQVWKNRHAEIHGIEVKPADKEIVKIPEREKLTTKPEVVLSYGDASKNCCLLCSRQFKSSVELNKHELLSKLHKENLNNEDLKVKALAKLKKAGITPQPIQASPNDGLGNDYRDRAKERRQAFGQPIKPQPKKSTGAIEETIESSVAPTRGPSKGASLLGKMGWSEGQGLGAQGTGVTAPIATDLYATGVGLGAAGGKIGDAAEEAQKRTKDSYGAFLDRTREGARDRFESLKDK